LIRFSASAIQGPNPSLDPTVNRNCKKPECIYRIVDLFFCLYVCLSVILFIGLFVSNIYDSDKNYNIFDSNKIPDLIVDGLCKLDAVDLIHVGLQVDQSDLGLLQVGGKLGRLFALLQLLVEVGQLLQVLKKFLIKNSITNVDRGSVDRISLDRIS
jgi:hypothetical protein